jgi:hypothetical protein
MTNLDWKRATSDETDCSHRKTWESRCQCYRVQESVSKFGLPRVYYALYYDGDCWSILSRHYKKETAQKACVSHKKDNKV